MLTPDRVVPLLIHDDPDVRQLAAHYFSESWSDDPGVLPMILDAHERHGAPDDRRILAWAHRFTVTEDSLDRVLDLLARTEDEKAAESLNQIVAAAPAEIVRGRWETIGGRPNIDRDTLLKLQDRIKLLDEPSERLWEELKDLARRLDGDEDVDRDRVDDLVETLGRRDFPDGETILRLLRELEPDKGWLELLVVQLAGRRRLREAVPLLVDRIQIDADFLLEDSSEALARIGAPETAALIRQAYPSSPDYFQLYTASLLGRIKHPDSEAAVLALLESETDDANRLWLCLSICNLFSEHAFGVVREQVRSGDPSATQELASPALALAAVFDVEPSPELKRLRRIRQKQRDKMRRFEIESTPEDVGGLATGGGIFPAREPATTSQHVFSETVRLTEPRIGRNDPCPCGSGKKFKKCCGRSR